jgi:hypothetical protein
MPYPRMLRPLSLFGFPFLLAVAGCSNPMESNPVAGANPMTGSALEAAQAEALRGSESMHQFNRPGNILVSDQFNNRVIEIDRLGGIVWSFGLGPNDVSAGSIVGVNDAQRVGALTLMAGTGAPAGTEPLCAAGCADNRVILVSPRGRIVWQYGQFGVTGADADQLSSPVQSTWLPNFHVLITDQGNQRIIEVTLDKRIVWQYGTTGVSGAGPNQLNSPNSAELLENGHVLISDEANNRAIEVNREKKIVATFTAGGTVNGVAFASRLRNGNTLLTDSNNNRAVEVDPNDQVVWQFVTNQDVGSNPSPLPTRAIRLEDGDTLISDQFNHRVIRVDHATPARVVASYGNLNQPGFGTENAAQGLNGPYDAKVNGDFTGLTPPFGHDFD